MPFASAADGTQLHFTDWGEPDARPVLLAHGFGGGQAMWNGQIPGLVEAGLRCVTFDRRGHGRSDVPGRGYDLDTLAGDIAAVARQLTWSTSCSSATRSAARRPSATWPAHADGRVAGLVLSAPSAPALRRGPGNPGGIDPDVFRQARQAMRDDAGAAIQSFSTEDFLGPGHAVSALQSDATRRQLVDLPLPVLLATFDTNAAADLRADLAGIDVPTLVIQGDADKNNPLELTGRRAAELIPRRRPRHPRTAPATGSTGARRNALHGRDLASAPSRRRARADRGARVTASR